MLVPETYRTGTSMTRDPYWNTDRRSPCAPYFDTTTLRPTALLRPLRSTTVTLIW